MMCVATHLLIGARAIAIALLLSLVPLLMPAQSAHAEMLPIPMNVQYDVTSAHAKDSAAARVDDTLQDNIIIVLETSNGDPEQIGDEIAPLVASPRPIFADSIVLFFEHGGHPHGDATPCWRPPTLLSFAA
ncbi:hypothetical protein D2T81_09530 [Azospirillum brasilense]|nr:hypothetical protein D2T81_09530 [Azospirillum brasilense]